MKKILCLIIMFTILLGNTTLYSESYTDVSGREVSTKAPTITNTTLASANTQYEVTVTNTKNLTFQCRTSYDIRYAFVSGKVATPTAPYMTLKADDVFNQWNIDISSMTIYFASSQAGVIVEVEQWAK